MALRLNKSEVFILKWSTALLILTIVLPLIIGLNNFTLCLLVSSGTGILKFLLNSLNFGKLIKDVSLSGNNANIRLIILDIFLIIVSYSLIPIILFILIYNLKPIDIPAVLGILLGLSYIPLVIFVSSLLQSLYIIKNKI